MGWKSCLAAAVPLTCIILHSAEMSPSPSPVVLELESFASQSCPSATFHSARVCCAWCDGDLKVLLVPGVPNRCWGDCCTGCSNLILLGCRASLGLGWGKEKEWCLSLSCTPQLKKTPKVIIWPCKFNLLWRSFEVAAVSEALEAELVCSW